MGHTPAQEKQHACGSTDSPRKHLGQRSRATVKNDESTKSTSTSKLESPRHNLFARQNLSIICLRIATGQLLEDTLCAPSHLGTEHAPHLHDAALLGGGRARVKLETGGGGEERGRGGGGGRGEGGKGVKEEEVSVLMTARILPAPLLLSGSNPEGERNGCDVQTSGCGVSPLFL